MKKVLCCILSIIAIFACFSLTGCSCKHEWEYVKNLEKYDGTCREQYKCKECGEFDYKDVEHSYGSKITVSATCSEKGGEYKECSKCGHQLWYYETDALGCNNMTESGTGSKYIYEETTRCSRCNGYVGGLITTYARISSGSNYYTFKGTIFNAYYLKDNLSYVKAKLLIYNKNDKVIHTDWTYAVGSMPLEYGETTTFDLMVKKDYCYNMTYFRFEYYN